MKIAIVGAGLTGCLCAYQLTQLGHNVTVLEKSKGKGGRSTQKRASWGEFDLGAPVIPVSNADFLHFLERLSAQNIAAKWPHKVHQFTDELSIVDQRRDYYVFTDGMNSACHFWLDGIAFVKECYIMHLQKTAGGWWLWDQQERKFGSYDWVVVTAPWPQTHALLKEVIDAVPELQEQDWTSCWAVACQLNQELDTDSQLIYAEHDFPVQTLVLNSAKPMRASEQQIWVAYLSNWLSDRLQKQAVDQVSGIVEQSIQQVFDLQHIKIVHSYQHYWRYARPHPTASALNLMHDSNENISACGDWVAGASIQASYLAVQQLVARFM